MKRHISIFALLLCAFATVGAWQATASVNIVCGEKVTLSYGKSSKQLSLSAAGNEGWYNEFAGDVQVTAPDSPPSDPSGTYRVEWLTLPENDTDTSGENSMLSDCTQLITGNRTITVGQMASAKTSAWTYYYGNSLIALKYIKRCTVSTLVSPETSGTVTGGGTYDEGENVTLTANASDGYEFKNWNGNISKTETTYVINGLSKDEMVTANFKARSYTIGKSVESATVTVANGSTYDDNVSISWGPSVEAGYDYAFSSVQVMSGSTVLKEFTDGTSGTFNMKTDAGRYYSSVTVKVVYNKTPQNRNLTLTFPATGIAQIGYKIGVANEWTYVTTTTQVPVPVGTKWQAYAVPADGYKTATSETKPQSGTMGANGAEFAPTAELDGFLLTVDPNGDPQKKDAEFHGNSEPYTYSTRLRSGMATLNALDGVATKADGAVLIEYRDSNGEAVYDAQGHNLKGTYWTEDYPAGVFQGTGNLTVKAIWGTPPEHCTITATCEPVAGGTVEPASTNVVKGKTVTLTAAENDGYSFKCWETGGETVSTDKSYSFTANADATYVAVFTGKVYTVMFLPMDGSPDILLQDETYGSKWTLPKRERSGYDLEGWYDLPNGMGTKLTEETDFLIIPTTATFIYANWVEKTKFDVVWTDPSEKNTCVTNHDVAVWTQIEAAHDETTSWPAKRDYNYWIKGWYPALPLTVTGEMTIAAVWESYADVLDCPDSGLMFDVRANWTVNTNSDFCAKGDSCLEITSLSGGENTVTTEVKKPGTFEFQWKAGIGTALYVSITGMDQRHFEYTVSQNWKTEKIVISEASEERPVSIRFSMSAQDLKEFCALDAVTWTPGIAPQKRTIDVAEGEHGSATGGGIFDIGENVTLTATADMGYAFCCWTNETGVVTNANPWTFAVADDAAYTATFTACVYRVMLNANGGTGGKTEVKAVYGEPMPHLESLPQLEHSTFLGYFDAATGGKEYYDAGGTSAATWDKTADAELFAQWKEDGKVVLTVISADETRGTVAKDPDGSSYYAGTTVTISAAAKAGYAFQKWSDESTAAIREITVAADVTYTATFTACVYRVTFDANGGETPSPLTKSVTFGATYGALATTTRNGYDFNGWWTSASGGTKIESSTTVAIVSDQTLYAHWEKKVGELQRALDCENLDFVATGGWTVFTNKSFAKQGVSCLSNSVQGAVLSTTVAESGTLKFYWRGAPNDENSLWLEFKIGDEVKAKLQVNRGGDEIVWTEIEAHVDLSAEVPKTLSFACVMCGEYCALDYFTWTPDGGGHPEPTDADKVTISSAAVSGGKFSLSFQSDERFDYNLLTNANLLINSWGVMKTLVGDGKVLTFEPQIIEGLPQLFYKVETIQKKD